MQRILTVIGDPNQINTWSNTPYFFLKASQKVGFLDTGLSLKPEKLKTQRLIWNFLQWVQSREKGGFQYTPTFLKQLFYQVQLSTDNIEFISHFPLLPPRPWNNNWKVNYYIDATSKQVFEDYGLATRVGSKIREAAIKQEQENYLQAQRIFCMSRWAAKSVVEDYQISPSKVYVIPGGANLDEKALQATENTPNIILPLNPLRLGFIGKDWQRKGLPYLLQVAEVLDNRGIAVEVIVIGPASQGLPQHHLLKPVGFIDKSKDIQKFTKIVRSFHFGSLFSSAEAFGISNLECLRLGVPVIASHVGGIPDTVPKGLGFLFAPDSPPKIVADVLEGFVNNPSSYYKLRQEIVSRAKEFTWQQTIANFIQVWHGSKEFLYAASK
jgi:glycosyltransferase involved in cell wall biosynthesis